MAIVSTPCPDRQRRSHECHRDPDDARQEDRLVAHDNEKRDLLEWATFNRDLLAHHEVYATGTTGTMLEFELGLPVTRLLSGVRWVATSRSARRSPRVSSTCWCSSGTRSSRSRTDPDVKALLRIGAVCDVPMACNSATADMLISSPLMDGEYDRLVPDYDVYRTRQVDWGGSTASPSEVRLHSGTDPEAR